MSDRGALALIGCGETREPMSAEVEQSCQQEEFRSWASALTAVAEIKDACGWISEPMRFVACYNAPFSGVLTEGASCADIRHAREVAQDFVRQTAPKFVAACKTDDMCQLWVENYQSANDGALIWWHLTPLDASRAN